MFTGIIKNTTLISAIRKQEGTLLVSIRTPASWKLDIGQSIAVNGICSTVKASSKKELVFQYIPETIRKTTVRWWKKGDIVNLERSMKFGDPLDGHLVTGHVEGIGQITAGINEKGDWLFKIESSRELVAQMVKKGSITVDGVSLTLADVGETWFAVALIPYTVAHTSWKKRKVGDVVNLETDILGRQQVKQIVKKYAKKTKTKAKTKHKKRRRRA